MFWKKKPKIDVRKESIEKAARWWANQLCDPSEWDNGDISNVGAMTKLLAGMARTSHTKEASDRFYTELVKIITDRWGEAPIFILSTDYHPGYYLQEAANNANVFLGMSDLPCKTTMWIRKDSVSVACGYAVSSVEL